MLDRFDDRFSVAEIVLLLSLLRHALTDFAGWRPVVAKPMQSAAWVMGARQACASIKRGGMFARRTPIWPPSAWVRGSRWAVACAARRSRYAHGHDVLCGHADGQP